MKRTWDMKTLNWVLGGLLIALSILTSMASYFSWSCFEPILIVTAFIAGIAVIVATLQYHGYEEGLPYNPREFWKIYSLVSAFVSFGIGVCCLNFTHLSESLPYPAYLAFPVIPSVGVVVGMIWGVVDDVRVSMMYR